MPVTPPGIGTTKFFFVPNGAPHAFAHGKYYFLVKMHHARVILTGGWWRDVQSVALSTGATTSGDPAISATGKNLNQAVRVNSGIRNRAISCAKNVVDILPSSMQQFNVQVELTATRRNPVEDFFKLVQEEAFATAFSFAPGPLAALKMIAPVVPGLLKVFGGDAPKEESALSASEDFTLASRPIQPGYLVVLSSMGENDELKQPIEDSMLMVTSTDVLLNDKPIVQANYVVLQFEVVQYRGIGGTDSQWVSLYERTMQDLDDLANDIGDRDTILETALKGLFAVTEMQSEDRTFTKEEMAIYRRKLRDRYTEVKAMGDGETPANRFAEVLIGDVEAEEVGAALQSFPSLLGESLQRLAAFEQQSLITRSALVS